MKKSDFMPYEASDIDILLNEPWEISDSPYRLHAAYALNCLYELCAQDDDDDETEASAETIWGTPIAKKTLDRLVEDIRCDFNDAASNRKPIRIWGKPYSIRKINAYDPKRLDLIFDFALENGEYIITKDKILNLQGAPNPLLKDYTTSQEESRANRIFLRKVIKLAEDDENDGWDKLTDMEIIVYCWAMYYNKHQTDNYIQFTSKYKDYIYVDKSDIIKCLNQKSALREKPTGMYAFSYDKVMDWNRAHNQISVADKIDTQEAEDYWYDVAIKKSFRPIDQR